MKWFNVDEKLPLDNNAKLLYCIPAKGYKQSNSPSYFIAKYCFCSGWSELVSNWELTGENRMYWDHLHKYEVTHWAELESPP